MFSLNNDDDLATAPTGAVFGTPSIYRNVTALTGACQLLRRSLFDEIGGYDARSLIAGSDIILCLRASNLDIEIFIHHMLP